MNTFLKFILHYLNHLNTLLGVLLSSSLLSCALYFSFKNYFGISLSDEIFWPAALGVTGFALPVIAIIGIFLGAIKTSDGRTWLERLGDFTGTGGDELAGSLILLALIVLFIVYATKDTAKEAKHS